ncbi:hypothetical protein FH609_029720 [Streptomyces sp. 3MP-14]|uniref:Ava_C0101 and related proteins n=1 Tax=Streptomyces mimosae TaxID=2586635 RepID=A0A5N5ZR63_9ACTN|nr:MULTISPECIES: DUF5996 family protein [Streptomyces]KAB8158382.1 hypothetical protein FH607_029345 [Streptomyces mimosae]KAB8172575.1 hypothetical protein FH609_029720 [Streptomyces sp. 3MP-14]
MTTTETRRAGTAGPADEPFASLPLDDWAETKETLHRLLQVVGKIRLAASPQRNHWWNVPFHVTGRGLTTRPMGQVDGNPIFTIDFDLVAHVLLIATLDGRQLSFPLAGESVADFYRRVLAGLGDLGVRVEIDQPHPFDLPDLDRPFDQDTEHRAYDRAQVGRYWRLLSQVNLLLEEFAARFSGKVSPVHHFWHTMDIAHTRFGERRIDQAPEVSRVAREAYSREVISFGFWFGDETVPEPAFYAYTAPEPASLAKEPLAPDPARWVTREANGHLAVLTLDDARAQGDARAAALRFYESAYQAGARQAGWDIEALACPGGITDPVRSAPRHG